MKRIAIIGGGIAGVTAAWQLARLAADGGEVEATLFEGSARLGGIVETVHSQGFTVECGPDAWVTDKPWARELAEELGLGGKIVASNDATRKTYVLLEGKLVAMPDGMRMMVPSDLDALDRSSLFSDSAKAAFRGEVDRAAELKSAAPNHDESVAEFVQRHFGLEVLEKIGAPLLSGVFGGDVAKLSARAVMAPFVAMEREHGSLIVALQKRASESASERSSVFTTLRSGVGTLVEAMVAEIPASWIRHESPVTALRRVVPGWEVETAAGWERFDAVMIAAPIDVARALLEPVAPAQAELMRMEASSAVVAGFGFNAPIDLPRGFGFLVPPGSSESQLLAGTFVDQKFPDRVPEGGRLLRGFFGGATADRLLAASDEEIASLALKELQTILGPLPVPVLTVVRRWPRALPQYAVGHLERMAGLLQHVESLGNLWLLGNAYRGVGLPDLIRDARVAALEAVRSTQAQTARVPHVSILRQGT
jgi:oxygen-dependent protoporphyrinogen oxidase